jgi:hypothetical protein
MMPSLTFLDMKNSQKQVLPLEPVIGSRIAFRNMLSSRR